LPRVLAVLAAIGLALAILATPASVDARPKPKPTPTPRPTPTVSPTPSSTASPTFVAGIDVSYHQGTIDWSRVAAAGKRFAFIRASAGTLTADTMYHANRSGARAAGLTIG
jgi:GH25 family lysozyme M1 (1,4-beta-N-acetylmuramidase)